MKTFTFEKIWKTSLFFRNPTFRIMPYIQCNKIHRNPINKTIHRKSWYFFKNYRCGLGNSFSIHHWYKPYLIGNQTDLNERSLSKTRTRISSTILNRLLQKNEDRNAVITIELIDYIYKEKVILLVARYQPILKSAELHKSMRYLSNRQHSLSISL